MLINRRNLLTAAAGAGAWLCGLAPEASAAQPAASRQRRFHYSVSGRLIDAEPEMLRLVREAGITDLWLDWWVGPPPAGIPDDEAIRRFREWVRRIEAEGMAAHLITVPLGHPGEGPATPKFPVEGHWGVAPNGSTYAGTACHPAVVQENLTTLERLRRVPFRRCFLDDDFRLAQTPFNIGGCFCPQHKDAFLKQHGYSEAQWAELVEAVNTRTVTPVLRAWLSFIGDELTGLFRQLRRAVAPDMAVGIMVMYLGSEKAGIRLPDYRDVPFRVGESMFDDDAFAPPKGKTDELFSVLFHRRFARPELAFSETTAYPAERLSPRNGFAKLCTSTIADVRNTMFMCANLADWSRREPGRLAAAIKKHTALHQVVAGHRPRGPFKHFWGEHSRLVGGDWPYSLFLATGVPFEVTERPATDGWTFLSDADARALAEGKLRSRGTTFIYRPSAAQTSQGRPVADTLADLFALRREILPKLRQVPYVAEELPVVCAWYPTARAVLLWNLQEQPVDLTLCVGTTRRAVRIEALELELVRDVRV